MKIFRILMTALLLTHIVAIGDAQAATYTDMRYGFDSSVSIKVPVKTVTTGNITLSGLQTVNSVALADGDRLLVNNQTDATQNGIYNVVASGPWRRATDFDAPTDMATGSIVFVNSDIAGFGAREWRFITQISRTAPVTIGVTPLAFTVVLLETDAAVASAQGYATTATTQAAASAASATSSSGYASNAQTYQSAASTAATNAASSASSAQGYATTATTQAGNATMQAANAATSATTATTQAAAAQTSATNASTSAGTATTQAGIATTQAGNASTSASSAATNATQAGSTLTSTSTTSNTIMSSGTLTFATQANKNYAAGQYITAAASGGQVNGTVNSYSNTTGSLVLAVTSSTGSGTFSSWTISVTGAPGANGSGTGTVTSVAASGTQGVTASVASSTSSPSITIGLSAITPSSVAATGAISGATVNALTLTSQSSGFTIAGGTTAATLTVGSNATVSNTNTGDQTTITGNAGTATRLQTARTINGVSFDGTANITIPLGTAANQNDEESGTATTVYTSPGTQQYHPSAAKAWVRFGEAGTPSINASYNVSSITRVGTGNYTINFTVPFSSANYAATATAMSNGTAIGFAAINNYMTGSCTLRTQDISGGSADFSNTTVIVYGDQ